MTSGRWCSSSSRPEPRSTPETVSAGRPCTPRPPVATCTWWSCSLLGRAAGTSVAGVGLCQGEVAAGPGGHNLRYLLVGKCAWPLVSCVPTYPPVPWPGAQDLGRGLSCCLPRGRSTGSAQCGPLLPGCWHSLQLWPPPLPRVCTEKYCRVRAVTEAAPGAGGRLDTGEATSRGGSAGLGLCTAALVRGEGGSLHQDLEVPPAQCPSL